MSRALGDAPYRGRGLIAEPELAPWRSLSADDAVLLLASDGVFEALPAEQACRIALSVATGTPGTLPWPRGRLRGASEGEPMVSDVTRL